MVVRRPGEKREMGSYGLMGTATILQEEKVLEMDVNDGSTI